VEYLACCGILEILGRFDPDALSWWEPAGESPRVWLDTASDENALLGCLTRTLTTWSVWESAPGNVQDEPDLIEHQPADLAASDEPDDIRLTDEGNEVILLTPSFRLNQQKQILNLDWWYETLKPTRKIHEKSGWKMYAGQQTAVKIYRDMVTEGDKLIRTNGVGSISALLKLSIGMTGRFGFDPRSSRNSLDAGFSANDLNLPITTYPFAEVLASIGANYFFPHRTRRDGGIASCRGWLEDDSFRYSLWQAPLPISLARVAATGAAINRRGLIPVRAGRAKRDKYSNLKMATTSVW
jgi:CRISPR-associated protein Csb3